MATNTTDVEILQVNTQPAVKSLAELKKEFKEAKAAINAMDESTEEFNKASFETSTRMNDFNEKMRLLSKSNLDFGTVVGNTSQALAGMSGLVQTVTGTLSLMGVEVGDDAKLMKTLVSAMSITQGLSAIDSGIKAVKALGIAIKGAAKQQKLFNAAALKNPYLLGVAAVIATMTAIVTAINKARSAEEQRHQEEMENLKKEQDEIIKKQNLYNDGLVDLARYQQRVSKMTADQQKAEMQALQDKIDNNQAALDELERQQKEADRKKIDRDRNELNRLEVYTKAWVNKQSEINREYFGTTRHIEEQTAKIQEENRALEEQQSIIRKTKPQSSRTNGSRSVSEIKAEGEALNSLIDRRIRLNQIYEDYSDEVKKAFNEIPSVVDKGTNEIGQRITSVENIMQTAIDASEKRRTKLQQNLTAYEPVVEVFDRANDVMRIIPERFFEAGKSFDDYTERQKAEINVATKLYTEFEKESIILDDLAKALKEYCIQKDLQTAEDTLSIKVSDNIVKNLEKETELLRLEGALQRENNNIVDQQFWNPSAKNNLDDIEYEAQQQQLIADMKFDITQEGLDREYKAQVAYYESLQELYKDDTAKQLEITNTLSELQAQYNYDSLVNEEERKNRSLEIAQQERDAKVALVNSYLDAYQSMSSAISGILGSIADTQEQGTKQWKNLKIAEAIINTLAGSVSAFMSGVNSGIPAPYNLILAATMATSTLAAGFAEVKKIQDTKVSKNSSSSSVRQATVQTINNNPSNVRTTNPQWNDEGQIENNITETNTTVTLVTSDLEALNSQNVNIQNNNQF